jgi:hypothetical protein
MREGEKTRRFEAAERPSHEATIVLAVRYYQIGSNSVPASPVFGDIRFSGNGFEFPFDGRPELGSIDWWSRVSEPAASGARNATGLGA